MNALLAVIAVAFLAWFLWFGLYGPDFGLISALALFFTGIAILGAAAFIIGRHVVALEHGFRTQERGDRKSRKKEGV